MATWAMECRHITDTATNSVSICGILDIAI
jgi:hypothetical protein